ncbi:beta-glucosidase family protein [Chimaeribacter arupi]|uniref:beta-glucosidase family protein n=1 Tax=Chimaeribacter arupi TaxID=2060066 RepID=UPI0029460AB5|nr:glycoside hydrolase family 3 C-terminal domain-containing protein [Chimaeribacter arupi]MDV5139703.1 glycoside hydrolase family 3 C-terminal domain-containing protein [Chimaeribacter arupi]
MAENAQQEEMIYQATAPADRQAAALVSKMTLDEKIMLVHAPLGFPLGPGSKPAGAVGSAAYTPGIPRLGIPGLQETDASLGIANPGNIRPGDSATALPSGLMSAATFSPELAYRGGEMLGEEAHAKGFNVLLAGGMNLIREPRNGRNFEYLSEDPLLTGRMAGEAVAGIQSRHVVSTVKHYALNAQETGRVQADSVIEEAAARESDLLAFQLALERGQPGSVMPGYNLVNGEYASENAFLLNRVLKGDWQYPGWVMSDWGATHSTEKAVMAGLDQQSGEELDKARFFVAPLKEAVEAGRVPVARLDDMVRRIVRSLIAVDGLAKPPRPRAVDEAAHAEVAAEVARQGMVLLKNAEQRLPLKPDVRRVVVIGGDADKGVMSGGGSSQVVPAGSISLPTPFQNAFVSKRVLHPSAPLAALRAAFPQAEISYDDGRDPKRAAEKAAAAEVAIVFAWQWMAESVDAPDLSLPDNQDALIEAVAQARPGTVVVLQTGGPVKMPWLEKVGAVLEAWYPGSRGGEAIADVLSGKVSPSGRLPVTFPVDESQLPRRTLPDPESTTAMPGLPLKQAIRVDYNIEGSDVGYRWFERQALTPLFPFGYGLTYSRFHYHNLKVEPVAGGGLRLRMTVINNGSRAATDTPQFYLRNGSSGHGFVKRLVGWQRITLQPGEQGDVTVDVDPRLIARWDNGKVQWHLYRGDYQVIAGAHAMDEALSTTLHLPEGWLAVNGKPVAAAP